MIPLLAILNGNSQGEEQNMKRDTRIIDKIVMSPLSVYSYLPGYDPQVLWRWSNWPLIQMLPPLISETLGIFRVVLTSENLPIRSGARRMLRDVSLL